jgi:hypothetical protein
MGRFGIFIVGIVSFGALKRRADFTYVHSLTLHTYVGTLRSIILLRQHTTINLIYHHKPTYNTPTPHG